VGANTGERVHASNLSQLVNNGREHNIALQAFA